MDLLHYAILIVLFFVTAAVGVVTGSNSLVTVPVMLQFNIDPKVAVATNMFGLTFMSIGAVIPFLKGDLIDRRRMPAMVLLTLVGSAGGALLVGLISKSLMPVIIAVSMVFVIAFMLLNHKSGIEKSTRGGAGWMVLAYSIVFVLAIYGGLYSGGYVTMLTASFIAFFGMKFTEAVANTKMINVVSSLIATLVFMWQGLVDYKLGAILGVTMFVAAYVGAKTVTRMSEALLKRIFLLVVIILAVKTLLDVALTHSFGAL